MATNDITNSSQRRRRLALMLALLLACTAIAIGGSMYYQQKKAKEAAVQASKDTKDENKSKEELGIAAGAGKLNTEAAPEAPLLGDASDAKDKVQKKQIAVAPRARKLRQANEKTKPKDDKFAESVLAQAPAGAGVPDAAPPAPVEPGLIQLAPQQAPTFVSIADPVPPGGPTPAPGEAPAILPSGTNGITPGGTTTVPVPAVPVPEPSTWLMMAAGLGLLASRLRRA